MKFARRNLGIIILSLTFLVGFVSIRMNGNIPKVAGYQLDGFLTCALALLIICLRPLLVKTFSALAFLGKHSANIYLLHTFWNYYWPTSAFIHNELKGVTK
jgi:peptidoglycan/LPS O-acetylase OafA/YrhL